MYKSGTALMGAYRLQLQPVLVLHKPEPKTVKVDGPDGRSVLSNIATHGAADQPAESERILRQLVPRGRGLSWLSAPIIWKMAKVDPARTRALRWKGE